MRLFAGQGGACNAVHYIQHYLYLVKHSVTFDKTSFVPLLKVRFEFTQGQERGPIRAVPFSVTMISVLTTIPIIHTQYYDK